MTDEEFINEAHAKVLDLVETMGYLLRLTRSESLEEATRLDVLALEDASLVACARAEKLVELVRKEREERDAQRRKALEAVNKFNKENK